MKSKSSILENVLVLALIGILIGGIAGFGIGVLTGRSSAASSSQ
jgi:ABC-type nitrate/sulfonate/bicarbonate transport system permease component